LAVPNGLVRGLAPAALNRWATPSSQPGRLGHIARNFFLRSPS